MTDARPLTDQQLVIKIRETEAYTGDANDILLSADRQKREIDDALDTISEDIPHMLMKADPGHLVHLNDLIQGISQDVSALHRNLEDAIILIGAQQMVLRTLQTQRDEAIRLKHHALAQETAVLEDRDKLINAINDQDTSDPTYGHLIHSLISTVESDTWDNASTIAQNKIAQLISELTGYEGVLADEVALILCTGDTARLLQHPELEQVIYDLMEGISERAYEYQEDSET